MVDQSTLTLLKQIEQNAQTVGQQGREVIPVGSFLALIDSSNPLIWLSYARPVAPLGSADEVAESLVKLRQVFRDRDRTLRFEFSEQLWPDLPAALEKAGLELQARQPLMICTPIQLQPLNAVNVEIQQLSGNASEQALATYMSIVRESFGFENEPSHSSAEEIERLRQQLHQGEIVAAIATFDGTPAGVGCTMPLAGIAELAGVGTRPSCRRRGVAATLSSFLVSDHFQKGGHLVWLSAGDAIAEAVYQRIGFRLVDAQLNYIEPNLSHS